jgi:hypothetical protein
MKIRYKLLASAAAVVVLSGVLAGTASAGQARPIKAPPVQVRPDGSVVFTAVKRGATAITPNAIIICRVIPVIPQVVAGNVRATAFTTCDHPVTYIAMTITLVHFGNLPVTKIYETMSPNPDSLFAFAEKICLPDVYQTKVVTFVAFPIDYLPPSASRTDFKGPNTITKC